MSEKTSRRLMDEAYYHDDRLGELLKESITTAVNGGGEVDVV